MEHAQLMLPQGAPHQQGFNSMNKLHIPSQTAPSPVALILMGVEEAHCDFQADTTRMLPLSLLHDAPSPHALQPVVVQSTVTMRKPYVSLPLPSLTQSKLYSVIK